MLIRYTVVYVKFFTLFCCSMDDSYRPVKLRKVVIGYSCNENTTNFKFDLSLNYKLSGIIHTYSENKPTLVVSTKSVKAQASQRTLRHCIHLYTGCIKKNGVHLLCQIISKLLKLIAQFWTCFKPRSFLFRTSRNSCLYSQ